VSPSGPAEEEPSLESRGLLDQTRALLVRDGPPIAGLLLLAAVFFWPILTGQAFLWGDFAERIYPFR
jgi:hypothetical protein